MSLTDEDTFVEASLLPGLSFRRIGFLASHGGSSMQAIVRACKQGDLSAEPAVVISNNAKSTALETANSQGIPAYHLSRKTEGSEENEDSAVFEKLKEHQADLIVLSGYMRPVGPKVLEAFAGRILNIHPSLLPQYGGKGMYGMHVHRAVIEAKEKETGITIHIVTPEYDEGPIVAQKKVPVLPDDTPETLAERVKSIETDFFVSLLQEIPGD